MVRRVLSGGLVLLLACVAGYALIGKLREPDRGGYPQRIGFDRPSDRLPARPGPLAGTLVDNNFGAGRDLGITPTGRLYELPGSEPGLSPSGTVLVTRDWDSRRHLEVHDLAAGTSRTVDDVSNHVGFGAARWSPDETRVLVASPPVRPGRGGSAVVELATGRATAVAGGVPAGFASDSEVVTIEPGRELVVTVTDLSDGEARAVSLALDSRWVGDPEMPLTAGVSPDGERLMVVERPRASSEATVRVFALGDGRELASLPVRGWDGCGPTWRGHDPVLPVRLEPGGGPRGWAGAVQVTTNGATSLVAVHPRLQSRCLVLTSDALEAGPRWALFGTSTSLVTWYAGPAALACAVVLAVVALVAGWRRRRSGRHGDQA